MLHAFAEDSVARPLGDVLEALEARVIPPEKLLELEKYWRL